LGVANEKLGRIGDEQNRERGAPPTRPEPVAEVAADSYRLGQAHPVAVWQLDGGLSVPCRRSDCFL
jgi:hypothetical protein